MTREVLERDNQDKATVILLTEAPEDVLADL
jgi:hypothetical protein